MNQVLYQKTLSPARTNCEKEEDYREFPTQIFVTEEANGYAIWFDHCTHGEDHDVYILGWEKYNRNLAIERGVIWGRRSEPEILAYVQECGIKI